MNNKILAEMIAEKVKRNHGETYYVGGYVRDFLRNVPSNDIDIEIHGLEPEELEKILADFGKVETIGKSFGVYKIHGEDLDIAIPRIEKAIGDGHKDFEITPDPFCGIEKAAERRDFAMNAIYMDVLSGEIIDPFGGVRDIENHIIRHIDAKRFSEDALRVFRAARFATIFGYDIDEETQKLMRIMEPKTLVLPRERVFGEMMKAILSSFNPRVFFDVLFDTGNTKWFKELFDLKGINQNTKYHAEGNVYEHTMLTLNNALAVILGEAERTVEDVAVLILSALCHDMGKAVTSTQGPDGIWHNYGHENELEPAEKFLNRLTNAKELIKNVLFTCKHHMDIVRYALNNVKPVKFYELIEAAGKLIPDLITLGICDYLGREMKVLGLPMQIFLTVDKIAKTWEEHIKCLEWKKEQAQNGINPDITGNTLKEFGIEPGRIYNEILQKAHHLWLSGVPNEHILKQIPEFKKAIKEIRITKGTQMLEQLKDLVGLTLNNKGLTEEKFIYTAEQLAELEKKYHTHTGIQHSPSEIPGFTPEFVKHGYESSFESNMTYTVEPLTTKETLLGFMTTNQGYDSDDPMLIDLMEWTSTLVTYDVFTGDENPTTVAVIEQFKNELQSMVTYDERFEKLLSAGLAVDDPLWENEAARYYETMEMLEKGHSCEEIEK